MRIRTAIRASALLLAILLTLGPPVGAGADDWVCPPCGHSCLKTSYEEPGRCPVCGMQLVERSAVLNRVATPPPPADETKSVAVLIFDGAQIIDFTGPWEVFGWAGFEVFTVAKRPDPVKTVFDMVVTPDHTIGDHPPANVVVVPGGSVFDTQLDPEVQTWLRAQADEVEVVLSVCNGAYILATAGLLDGLRATTTRPLVDGLTAVSDKITAVHDVRFVDNGKIVTAGGLSAGMDASLHVVSRFLGPERAERIAAGLEYEWRRDPDASPPASPPIGEASETDAETATAHARPAPVGAEPGHGRDTTRTGPSRVPR